MPIDSNRVRDVFLDASELPAADRPAFLAEVCGPDIELRVEVERLLAASAEPASVLKPAIDPAAWIAAAKLLPPTDHHEPQPDVGVVLAGRYTLLEAIGEGGMGTVWMAKQTEPVKRLVAVKLIKAGMDSKAVLARFEAERQALALMDHPNIARVLDAGVTANERPFFVMDLVRGVPITQFCDSRRLTPSERLELFVQVCHAIQHAHQKGIIHRDIKPSNVLVALYDDRAVPKVIDFGVAKATGQPLTEKTFHTGFGTVIGTPQYVSPEQATFNNLDVDTRSDLYSLGALLYELLAGSPPFTRKELEQAGVLEMLRVVREVEPPRPSTKLSTADTLPSLAANRSTEPKKLTGMLRNELDWIVMKALEKDRTRRYETANGFAADVLRYLSGEPVQAVPPSAAYRIKKFVRKHRGPVTAGTLVLLALLVGIAGTTSGLIRADAAREAEHRQRKLAEIETDRANKETVRAQDEATKARASAEAEKLAVRRAQRLLGLMNATEGLRLADSGQIDLALLRMTHSLIVTPESPESTSMARTQFALYRRYSPSGSRLSNVFPHGDAMATFSRDGRRVLTGNHDGTTRTWDVNTGRPVTPLMRPASVVKEGTFSLDGRRVATVSENGTLQVWNADTGERLSPLLKHADEIGSVTFSPDGRWILTASQDGTAGIWEADTGKRLVTLQHGGVVWSAVFSPDGGRVLTASEDGTARVWDANTGKQLLPPLQYGARILSAVFSPDGQRVLTSGRDGLARVWDAHVGKKLLSLDHASEVCVVAFTADGRRIITGCFDGTARVWDANSGKPLTPPLPHTDKVESVAVSPDGRRVLIGSWGKTARVWDLNTGKPLSLPIQHARPVYSVAFSPDGRRLLTVSDAPRVWEITGVLGVVSPVIQPGGLGLGTPLEPMAISRDGRRVLAGGFDKAVRVWDVDTGTAISERMHHADRIVSVAFSPNGRLVVTGSEDRTARVWDAETGKALTRSLDHSGTVWSVAFSPEGDRVLTGSWDKTARVWDAKTGKALTPPLEHEDQLMAVAFSPCGDRVLTGGGDKTARVWDIKTGKVLTSLIGHDQVILALAFSPDGTRALTGSWDKTARVWDVATGRMIASPLQQESQVNVVAFSPNGRRVVVGCYDGTARIWDVSTGKALTPPLKHADVILSVAFSPDGQQVLTGSWDQTARLWDAETGKPLSPVLQHTDSVKTVAFSSDGRRALTGCSPGSVSKWEVFPDDRPTADVVALAQLLSGHQIDESGAATPLQFSELSGLWEDLRSRYPDEFKVHPEAIRRWREGEIRDCMKEGNLRAARFHYWAQFADLASGMAK